MRVLLILAAVVPAIAQSPVVRVTNTTRPASNDFQIGDRFEIVIVGAANQSVSVRTTTHGRTDWSPVIGETDITGHWSTSGQFEKTDFGDWREVWTVDGKLANPAVHFSVNAPCLKGGRTFIFQSGPNFLLTCETAEGEKSFASPSDATPFRTPDGRMVPGRDRSSMTAEQYHAEVIQCLILSNAEDARPGYLGDRAGALMMKMIGVNALSEDETRNVLLIVRAAFEKPERIPEDEKVPSQTLLLLRKLADLTSRESLKRQIAETTSYVQAR